MRKTLLLPILLLAVAVHAAAAPSAPSAPAAQVAAHSVTLTWNPSVSLNVASYNVKRSTTSGGPYTTLANVPLLTFLDTTVQPGTTYDYVISALDATGSESPNSLEVSAAIPGTAPPPPDCSAIPVNVWTNTPFASQSAQFQVDADVTPGSAAQDSLIGLSKANATTFTSLAAIVWFSPAGTVQARNAGAYIAATIFRYSAGVAYHVRAVVNPATRTYSAWIHTGSNAETQIANNFAFRTEQGAVTSLNNFAAFVNVATPAMSVCNFALSSAAPPPVTITIAPTTKSLVEGATQQFTATVGNATNTAVTWTSTAGTVTPTGLFTAGATPMNGSVTATSVADPTKSASASITVTAPPPALGTPACAASAGLLTCATPYSNYPSGAILTNSVSGSGASSSATTTVP